MLQAQEQIHPTWGCGCCREFPSNPRRAWWHRTAPAAARGHDPRVGEPAGTRRAEQAPVQGSRVLRSQTAAKRSTSAGAGGARALHKPSRRAAKTDSFPLRLLQYFPSEPVKLTNAQPGQAKLTNASSFIWVNRTGSFVGLLPPKKEHLMKENPRSVSRE